MTVDTALIYEFALGEGDQYAAALAAILNGVQTPLEETEIDPLIEEPDF